MILLALVSAIAFSVAGTTQIKKTNNTICITKSQKNKIVSALHQLEDIHNSKVRLDFSKPVIIIRDWKNRVYISGGAKKPIRARLRIGKYVDRDLAVQFPIQIYYRKAPPEPWFRLRIRAQLGILVPEAITGIVSSGKPKPFWDAGIGWDFFHIPEFGLNLAAYTGIRSAGGGIGLDLTKNFGVYTGYSVIYSGFRSSILSSVYFSFN